MFACYRRGDANDPDGYVAAVASVLARYEPAVIETVTDPYSGIPGRKSNGWSGMPDVADVKEACEAEANRRERIKELGAVKAAPRLRIDKPKTPGYMANVLVLHGAPQYAALHAMTQEPNASNYEWKHDEQGRGLWVSLKWMDRVPYRPGGRVGAAA